MLMKLPYGAENEGDIRVYRDEPSALLLLFFCMHLDIWSLKLPKADVWAFADSAWIVCKLQCGMYCTTNLVAACALFYWASGRFNPQNTCFQASEQRKNLVFSMFYASSPIKYCTVSY